ncbi:ferredoxin Fer [Natronomonas amylolytica]|uniref:ferredoxin Fer n=1 Tax=Natronomonas amylolytica TaxID=3108498 RepID=UPI00300B9E52
MPSPFEVLEIEPGADEETVERAYRQRIKDAHPDHGGSQEAFRRVRRAYEAIQSGDVDAEPEPEASPEPDPEPTVEKPPEERPSRVEYLDYEVLADFDWSVTDDDLFEKAADANLDTRDYGRFLVEPGEFLLEAAEERGFTWPFACRGGACANCAVKVVEGELSQPVDHILSPELVDRGIRLSCVGEPLTEELRIVYNVKHLPELEELRLPPGPFKRAKADD